MVLGRLTQFKLPQLMFLGFLGCVYNDPVLEIKKGDTFPLGLPRANQYQTTSCVTLLCSTVLIATVGHCTAPVSGNQCTYCGHHHSNTLFVVAGHRNRCDAVPDNKAHITIASDAIDINLLCCFGDC